MKKYIILTIAFSISLLSGCATVPTDDIKIEAEADPKVNFSGYKTYTWFGSAELLIDPQGKWKQPKMDVDKEIQFLIDRELRKRGMTEKSAKPDMIVAYAIGVDMAALKFKKNPETEMKVLKNVPKGALIIVLVDPKTRYVMWMGRATGDVQKGADIDVVKGRLDYAVSNMLKKLPK